MKYITVANNRNRIATVHVASCAHVIGGVNAQSDNAKRRGFDDGLDALEYARAEQPNNFGFCAHCLASAQALLSCK